MKCNSSPWKLGLKAAPVAVTGQQQMNLCLPLQPAPSRALQDIPGNLEK